MLSPRQAAAEIPEDGRRVPFGWSAIRLGEKETIFHIGDIAPTPNEEDGSLPIQFRLTAAVEFRHEATVEISLAKSERKLGALDLRYGEPHQLFSLTLSKEDAVTASREGVTARVVAGDPVWIFSGNGAPMEHQPHLLVKGKLSPAGEFFRRMASPASIQPFGWMEGCVLDGLLDLAESTGNASFRRAALSHLALFTGGKGEKPGDQLILEDHFGKPSDGKFFSIESVLPLAALSRVEPSHPLLALALPYWKSRINAAGVIADWSITSEGSYTVSYVAAELARASGKNQAGELREFAIGQARARLCLFDGREFFRIISPDGRKGNRNWLRGIAWHLLGLARTLAALKKGADRELPPDLVAGFTDFSGWVLRQQRPDSLWDVFSDDPSSDHDTDTSGAAGTAAALAIGARIGLLPESALAAAEKSLRALEDFLTPDGFLTHATQSNKCGESIQRSRYRVIYPMGMGLLAQLYAACEKTAPRK